MDLCRLVEQLNEKGVSVQFCKEHLTFAPHKSDLIATLQLQMMTAFAEFERTLILERQRERRALAKQTGVYRGRKRCLTPEQVEDARAKAAQGVRKTDLARHLGVSRETLYNYLKAYLRN